MGTNEEIKINQEAYSLGAENLYLTDTGEIYTNLDEIPKERKIIKKMTRTDTNDIMALQNHGTPTSLDITAYNIYPQDGSKSEKPEKVVVGVAGSADAK